MIKNPLRRKLLKDAGMVVMILPFARFACASRNASLRSQFQYQETPLSGKSCSSCLEFLPGKAERDPGGCKRIPGDDEISPDGYCTLWNTL